VASIFGVGYANTSPITVWAEKTGAAKQEFDAATLKRMNRGKRLEPYIAMEFEEETGFETVDPGDFTIYRSDTYEWLFATLDRWCRHPEHGCIPVELKAVNGRFRGDWDEDIEPPLKYMVQCQTQMAVTGASHCYLVGLIGGDELSIRLIERNDRFIEAMLSKLARFWIYVLKKEMPPVDESEATKAVIGLIYPHDSGEEVSLPVDFFDLDRELLELKDQRKQIEAKIDGIENRLKAAIGGATWGSLPGGGRYSWKEQSRRSIDADLLRERHPEIALECEKCSTFRVLRRVGK
jgi:predicted phage-related endonuclease